MLPSLSLYQRVIEALHATVLQYKITSCILAENSYYIFILYKTLLEYFSTTVYLLSVISVTKTRRTGDIPSFHGNILALPLRATVLQLDFGSVKMEKKFYYI